MRTVAACVVLAAAIATPGIVVGAIHSSPGRQVEFMQASARLYPVGSPINPRLRPTVRAVTRALARRSVRLTVVPSGVDTAQAIELRSRGRCPVVVWFGRRLPRLSGPCDAGNIDSPIGPIGFTPASIGPMIRQALATLPGGHAG